MTRAISNFRILPKCQVDFLIISLPSGIDYFLRHLINSKEKITSMTHLDIIKCVNIVNFAIKIFLVSLPFWLLDQH